jgi:hypothetical protein
MVAAQTRNSLTVLTSYFNPSGYKARRENYEMFSARLRDAGVPLLTVECAFRDDEFAFRESPNMLRVRAQSVLWQKERLLNLMISRLPPQVTMVAWVDCDLIWENSDWVRAAEDVLRHWPVVQLFDVVVRLPEGQLYDVGEGEHTDGFGATFSRRPWVINDVNSGRTGRHGHTGFAWAARREVLKHGLYDACLSGNGDHLMAHAFVGDWESECFRGHFDSSCAFRNHFETWSRKVYELVKCRVGYVPGKVLHLWHGEHADRQYLNRGLELNAFAFDPSKDLSIDAGGCYSWSSNKPELHRWAERYFVTRREDGGQAPPFTRDELCDRVIRARDRACSKEHAERLSIAIQTMQTCASIEGVISIAAQALGVCESALKVNTARCG